MLEGIFVSKSEKNHENSIISMGRATIWPIPSNVWYIYPHWSHKNQPFIQVNVPNLVHGWYDTWAPSSWDFDKGDRSTSTFTAFHLIAGTHQAELKDSLKRCAENGGVFQCHCQLSNEILGKIPDVLDLLLCFQHVFVQILEILIHLSKLLSFHLWTKLSLAKVHH